MNPKRKQQPTRTEFFDRNQYFNVECRSWIIFNRGTGIAWIDGFPVLPGMVHQMGATEDGILCYTMNVVFDDADTKAVYFQQLNDVE